jgi:hypothetical protein
LLALLQADWPLQALTPVQCVIASVPAIAVLMKPVPNSTAAAVATAMPEVFFNRMVHSSFVDVTGQGPVTHKTGPQAKLSRPVSP